MKERMADRLDRIDSFGGRLVARFWGAVLLIGILVGAIPLLVGSISTRSWSATAIVGASTVAGLLFVRHLFSSKRRLSEME
ncbi:MAG: hypothetical protein HKN07_02955 [Acidimicrobiia bacterium]|nr:hypothetical protein [Acidimicrobiia bacterium]